MKFEPRNIGAARRHVHEHGPGSFPAIVVSLIGETGMRFTHVYVDPGRSYDYSGVQYAQCVIATKPGVDSGRAIAEVFDRMQRDYFCSGLLMLADVEREEVVKIDSIKPLRARSIPRGSKVWAACFG